MALRLSQRELNQLQAQRGGKVTAEKAKDERPWDQRYKSRTEQRFAESGWREFDRYLEVRFSLRVRDFKYEPNAYRLPGGSYTPDFICRLKRTDLNLAERACVEVKAKKYYPSYQDSRSKVRASAAVHTWDYFFVAWWSDGQWRFERIG